MPRTAKAPAAKKPVVHRTRRPAVKRVSTPHRAAHVKRSYIFSVGRRKEAVARVRWHLGSTEAFTVNGRPMEQYFPTIDLQKLVREPLVVTEQHEKGTVTAKVAGGGIQGQAESVRLGIARALVKMDPDFRLTLKRAGFLRRDPRVKERKKYGLKRARRAPQWQKR